MFVNACDTRVFEVVSRVWGFDNNVCLLGRVFRHPEQSVGNPCLSASTRTDLLPESALPECFVVKSLR